MDQEILIKLVKENLNLLITIIILFASSAIVLVMVRNPNGTESPSTSSENELYDENLKEYLNELKTKKESIPSTQVPWEIGVSSKSASVAEQGNLRSLEFTHNLGRPTSTHIVDTIAKAIIEPREGSESKIHRPEYAILLETASLDEKEKAVLTRKLADISVKLVSFAWLEENAPETAKLKDFSSQEAGTQALPSPQPKSEEPQKVIPMNPTPNRGCVVCKQEIIGKKPSQCSACRAVIYDSVECAKKDWAEHKNLCPEFKKIVAHIQEWDLHDFPFTYYNKSNILHNFNVVPFLTTHSSHNVGLFQRLCGCFNQIPWGGLNAGLLLQFHTQKPTPEKMFDCYGLKKDMFPLSRPFPDGFDISSINSWKSYYESRGYSMDNPAALILEVPLTIWYFIQNYYLKTAPPLNGGRRKITIHLIGAEKEADMLPLFECLLPLLPKTDIAIHMIGNAIARDIPAPQRAMAIRSVQNESTLFMSVTSGLYQPQHIDGTAYKLPDDIPEEVLNSQNFGSGRPDLIIAMNAQLVVHGEWYPAMQMIVKSRIKFLVTERMEQLCNAVESNLPRLGAVMSEKTKPNPFKQPLYEFKKDVNIPGWSNGFYFAIN